MAEPEWRLFEKYCVQYYNSQGLGHAIPFNRASTDLLLECGYLRPEDIRGSRLDRLEGHKEWGLDAIGIRQDGGFDGLQFKCYSEGNYVCDSKIGRYAMAAGRMKFKNSMNGGVLYIKKGTKLSRDVMSSLHRKEHGFIVKELEYDTPDTAEETPLQEIDFNPRPIQIKALDFLKTAPRSILYVACAVGKTYIISKHIKEMGFDRVIMAAPYIDQADQICRRVGAFLDEHPTMNYWSGSSEFDVKRLKNFVSLNSKFIISTTFDSANEVYENVYEDIKKQKNLKTIVVIDEAHHLGFDKDKYNTTLNRAHKLAFEFPEDVHVSLLTATAPKAFEILKEERGFKEFRYTMSDAISDKNCCDYTISLPYIEDQEETSVDRTKVDMETKARFHVTCMMHDGTTHGIVYCNDKDECREYVESFEKVCKEYMGVDCWTGIVVEDVALKERKRLFQEFQEDCVFQEKRLKVLMSVNILNEGINLPRCDNIYVTSISNNVKESTVARIVQRSMRAARIDANNPDKIAKIYVWTDGSEEDESGMTKLLWSMQQEDPLIFDRVRYECTNYDTRGNESVEEKKKEMLTAWKEEWKMKIMNPRDWVELKVKVLETFYKKHAPKRENKTYQISKADGSIVAFGANMGYFVKCILSNFLKENERRIVVTSLDEDQKRRLLNQCKWLSDRIKNLQDIIDKRKDTYQPTVKDKYTYY